MGTYYADSRRPDNTGDGTSWASAKKNIANALALAQTPGGGHRVYVAPGFYDEYYLAPSVEGAIGNKNVLKGDADGSLGSGLTGPVVIAKKGSSNTIIAAPLVTSSNYWGGWEIDSLLFYGGSDGSSSLPLVNLSASSASVDPRGLAMRRCIVLDGMVSGSQDYAIRISSWLANYADAITIDRCTIIQQGRYAQGHVYVFPLGVTVDPQAETIKVINSIIYGWGNCVFFNNSSQYIRSRFIDCTFISLNGRAFYGQNPATHFVNMQRCFADLSAGTYQGVTMSYTDASYYFGRTDWPELIQAGQPATMPLIYLRSNATIIDAITSASAPLTTVDLHGTTRPQGDYRDAGAQEFNPAGWLQAPTMAIPIASGGGGGGGGGCPIIGGSIVRRG